MNIILTVNSTFEHRKLRRQVEDTEDTLSAISAFEFGGNAVNIVLIPTEILTAGPWKEPLLLSDSNTKSNVAGTCRLINTE